MYIDREQSQMPRRKKRSQVFRELVCKRWKVEGSAEVESHEFVRCEPEENEAMDTREAPDEFQESPTNIEARSDTSVEKSIRIQKKFELLADENCTSIEHEKECKYILVDFSELSRLLTKTKCADCGEASLKFALSEEQYGFAHKIILNCEHCELNGLESKKSEIYTSKRVTSTDSHRPPFDVNLRLSTAFRYMGEGYAGIEQFSMIMNMRPFVKTAFDRYSKTLEASIDRSTQIILGECRVLVKKAYEKRNSEETNTQKIPNENDDGSEQNSNDENTMLGDMSDASAKITENLAENVGNFVKDKVIDNCINMGVSYDGSWPTRGYKSKHGFGSVIDILTGFVLDFEIVSKFCQACAFAANELGEDSPEFFFWLQGHAKHCPINHTGSSGAMETSAAEIIWRRSETYGYRFVTMLSDGDAKTFNHLSGLNIYGDEYPLTKEECINHVEKR